MNFIIILAVITVGVFGYFIWKKGDQDGDGDVDLKDIKVSAKEVAEDAKDKVEDVIDDVKEVAKKVTRKKPGRKKKS